MRKLIDLEGLAACALLKRGQYPKWPRKRDFQEKMTKGGVYPQRTAQSIRGPFFLIYCSPPLPLIAFFSFIFLFSFFLLFVS